MFIGIKSCYKDGTSSVQIWNKETGEQIGEFEHNSPKIPENCIICSTVGEFNSWFGI